MSPINETILLNLMLNAPMGICIMDAETQVSEAVNDAFLEVAGRPREQIIGRYYWDTFAEVRHLFEDDLNRASLGETIRGNELEIPLIRYGKEEQIMISFIYMPLRDDAGKVQKVAVWVIENTKEVKERQAITESEQRFRALVTATSDVVYCLSADWEVMQPLDGRGFLKDTQQPITGWRRQNVHADDLDRVNAAIAAAIRAKKIFQLEHKVNRADGSPGWTFSRAVPILDEHGEILEWFGMASDVTERVLAGRRVKQSEANLRAMIAQAPVAMCILTGSDHVITVANRLIVELWGKDETAIMNKPVFDALPDARGQGLEEVMKKVYESGETFYASELPVTLLRHGQQEVVYQNFVYQAYRDASGVIAGVVAITIDVTEQVRARQTIEQTRQRLEAELEVSKEVQQQKDAFIGMASHELKTPLTSLNALLQVASLKLKDSPDNFLPGAMAKANLQVRRMTAMINGFLNVSRLEAGQIQLDKKAFDLDELIGEVLEETRLIAGNHQLNYEPCGPVPVNADRDKISSVLSNLVNNAIKYSPKGKLIEIKCTAGERDVMVSVRDEGMGIKPADIRQIFDRYYRIKNQHTQQIAGFGIGLYLSAEIVRRHDGRIWVESESGVGSTFYFTLPL